MPARRRWRGWCAALLGGSLLAVSSCTAVVTPPSDVVDPVTVWIGFDGGLHNNLVLPLLEDAGGDVTGGLASGAGTPEETGAAPSSTVTVIEYSYGDWDYYAAGQPGFWNGFAAIAWPTNAAFGRRRLSGAGPTRAELVDRRAPSRWRGLQSLVVERELALRLSTRLEARWHEGVARDTPRFNPAYDLLFVPDPRGYHAFHTCNTLLVTWLEELGCEVDGSGMFGDFVVR